MTQQTPSETAGPQQALRSDVRGSRPDRRELFPAAREGAPLLVFVHGGYWQELSKNEAAFAAHHVVSAGVSFAALGYGLAPTS